MTASLHSISPTAALDPVEAELAKDIWDVRHLPGVWYEPHQSAHLLNFTKIPTPFRALVKQYLRFSITRCSLSACRDRLIHLGLFFDWYCSTYPSAGDVHHLTRTDIEIYLVHLQARTNRYGKPTSADQRWRAVHALKFLLEYLERSSSPAAPLVPVSKLIWPGDCGIQPRLVPNRIKYVPEFVLQQFEQHVHTLPAVYLPAVILLRASGWRTSDILNLRYDTCLERTPSDSWLCGDIRKTRVLNHKVPISEEIAVLVAAQCGWIKEHYSEQDNPERYLFPAHTPQRKGRPLYAGSLQNALNRLAVQHDIRDEAGNLFHFNAHAFRHTKAVELINNGMSLVHVQKWLAHLTPEMTLVYAKILDSTMRKEWEQAFAKGAVRVDIQGLPKVVTTEYLSNQQEIEWEHIRHNLDAVRLPNGYCFKPKKASCPTQAIPCYSCSHFCTTPDFLPQFEQEERETRELIELGKKAGSVIWVERNTQKLDKLLPVMEVLRKGDLHHPAGKTVREYTKEEREKGI
jgi:integrase